MKQMLCIKTFITSDGDILFKKGKIYNIIFENKKIHAMSEQQYSIDLTHDDIKDCFIYMTNSEYRMEAYKELLEILKED